MLRTGSVLIFLLLAFAAAAAAQPAPGGCKIWSTVSDQAISVTSTSHYRLIRNVQVDCNGLQFFADEVEVFSDADRLRASGHVVFVSSNNRISAERMEFNTRTRTGTFYVASGIASLENRGIDRSLFGTQEPDAYFWGETIEKLGPKTYRVTHGGFTTCVQPTPRWELVSDSVTLTLEEHAVLKNVILKVKNVPLFYMPVMYYPINKEDRATGFLIPTYGSSTIRGQTISNYFFWAINRSQDATIEHDFFSKTGQGIGGEYRYVQAPGSQGQATVQYIAEHDATYEQSNGAQTIHPGNSSYSIRGSMSQRLPANMRLTALSEYFSSVTAQQRYQQNLYAMTNRTRRFSTGISGNWGRYSLSGTVDRTQTFSNETSWSLYGGAPRITVARAESPIGTLPLYFGLNGEYATILREDKSANTDLDRGLSRVDFYPTLRFPFTRWPFLTFNSSLIWRATFWSESLDPAQGNLQVPESIHRTYFDMSTRITGPVFTRIWSRPKSKLKHVIEPTFTVQRITPIENASRIVPIDGVDLVVGSVTRVIYGLNNRLYSKKDVAREVLTVSVSQSYYTDPNAAARDAAYQSGYSPGLPPTHLSPVQLQVRASPAPEIDATFKTEYDTQVHALRTVAATGTWSRPFVTATAGWSQRRFIANLPNYDNPLFASNGLIASTQIKSRANKFGGVYSFNYDFHQHFYQTQRYMAYYNSQCCGIAAEFQSVNYGAAFSAIGVTQDHRFNLSFTLAGIGTFSNLLGAFGGQQAR